MNESITYIEILGSTDAERDQWAGQLAEILTNSDSSVVVARRPAKKGTQDAGAVLQIILNATAVVAVARGIAHWLRMRQAAEVRIERHDGTKVIAKKISSVTAQTIIEATLRNPEEPPGQKKAKKPVKLKKSLQKT